VPESSALTITFLTVRFVPTASPELSRIGLGQCPPGSTPLWQLVIRLLEQLHTGGCATDPNNTEFVDQPHDAMLIG
jgi:hypothetical protein